MDNNFDPLFRAPVEVRELRQSTTELAEVISRTLVTAITDAGEYVNVFPTRIIFHTNHIVVRLEVK